MAIGSQRYIRTIQEPSGFGFCLDGSVSANKGTGAFAFQYSLNQQTFSGFIVHYDSLGRRLHEAVAVDPDEEFGPRALRATHFDGVTALTWPSRITPRAIFMKLCTTQGDLSPERIIITQGRDISSGNYAIVCHENNWIVGMHGRYFNSGPDYIWIDRFDASGELIAPEAEYPVLTYGNPPPDLAVLDSGEYVLGLTAYVYTSTWRARVQSIDGTRVWTDPGTTWDTGVFGLCKRPDNTVSALYGIFDVGAAWLMHLNTAMQPLGEPMPVAFAPLSAAFRSNGDFALLARPSGNQIRLHLYDVNGQPTASPFNFVAGIASPYHDTASVEKSLAYEDDGTLWICWRARGGFDASNYLCILKPYTPGDVNLDGRIDNFDIDAFVLALTDAPAYETRFNIPAHVGRILGDVNFDNVLNNFDIDPFVELLVSQP
ncbi:MAG: hypothetical protein AB7Q17_10975 [Phycisphaerae bacterium]